MRIVIVLVNGNMERHEPQETGDDAQDDHDHSELSSELSFTPFGKTDWMCVCVVGDFEDRC